MFKLILCLSVALKLASAQYNGIIWDTNSQYQPQPQPQYNQPIIPQVQYDEKYRSADTEEPIVGSPLLPIIPPVIAPKLFSPFGVPGLRFSNLNAGRFGSLIYGNTLLGSSNPMAEEGETQSYEPQISSPYPTPDQQYQVQPQYQAYQADPQIAAAPYQSELGHGKFWWKKWANPDEQSESIVGNPGCGQAYSSYQPQPYNYQVSSPYNYQVSSPYNYQAYQPQPAYAPYQPALPQINYEYPSAPQQPSAPYYSAKSSGQSEAPAHQPSSALIVQPSGTYEESEKPIEGGNEERTWDWHWEKGGKKGKFDKGHDDHDKHGKFDKFDKFDKHDKKDKFKDKFNKDKGHKVFYKGVYTVPAHHHEPEHYHYHYEPKPVYTKPAPAYDPSAYNNAYSNYYNTYRSNSEAEEPVGSEVKTEVDKHELKITTTELPSNKTTTTTMPPCNATNEATTKENSTTESKDLTTESTTTEKPEKKRKDDKKSKKTSRRRRNVPNPTTNSKRCITFNPINPLSPGLFGVPLLGAPNPNAAEPIVEPTPDQDSNPSENCESGNCLNVGESTEKSTPEEAAVPREPRGQLNPQRVQQLFDRMREPYLGAVQDDNKKLWNNNGVMGIFMGPLEDTYLEYVKHHENLPQLQDVRIIT